MTKQTISDAALESIHGGTDIAQDSMGGSSDKSQQSFMDDASSGGASSGGGNIDTVDIAQNNELPGA